MPAAQSRKTVAVHVLDDGALASRHDERIGARVGRRHVRASRSMMALALGRAAASSDQERSCAVGAFALEQLSHFRFHCVPGGACPRGRCPARPGPARMRSAAAKSRRMTGAPAALRSARSISSTGTGGALVLGAPQRHHAQHAVEASNASRITATSGAPTSPASIAAFRARTSSNIDAERRRAR